MTKLLVVASSLDLTAPLSSTPSWWQLLKALAERGVDLVVAPYQGPAIESPWWSAAANPCQVEGDLVGLAKRVLPRRSAASGVATPDRVTHALVERWTKPRWQRHLVHLLQTEHRDVSAVLFLTVPPNHFGGIPTLLARRFGIPTYFYDGDVPASLPRFDGFRTGFRIYDGADLSEYAAVFSSSKGGLPDLNRLGARKVHLLYYAADPTLFDGPPVDQDLDVFFYGHGAEYREQWLEALLDQPSRAMPEARFAVRGTRLGPLGRTQHVPYASFAKVKDYCRRSRINVVITRQAHASVYASSTARPFELAALGCAMVSNPYHGVEEWFEPEKEILIVNSAAEAIETYRSLLSDPAERCELARRARARLLQEHTYAHRAAELMDILDAAVSSRSCA